MKQRLQRLLPDTERLRNNRWLRWLGPALFRQQLWHITRRGVALGVALGIFFGLLFPVGQIPCSAAAAMVLRANIPAAVASTLVTNPVTFAPIYYAAYQLGAALLGETEPPQAIRQTTVVPKDNGGGWMARITALGKPLLLGLFVLASSMGVLAYLLISSLWRLKITLAWRRRRTKRNSSSSEGS